MIQKSTEQEAEDLINQYLELVIDADRDNVQSKSKKISLAKRGALICVDKMISNSEKNGETVQIKSFIEIKKILKSK
jgi:tRNA A37 threonylcarbamoyladenosine dehydratase